MTSYQQFVYAFATNSTNPIHDATRESTIGQSKEILDDESNWWFGFNLPIP